MGARAVGYYDLEFDRYIPVQIKAADSQCLPFTRWAPVGMPRIPEKHLNTVFFLYPDKKSAQAGRNGGGTGFFVTVPSETHPRHKHLYAVTNWHVACQGSSVIRVSMGGSKPKIIEKDPSDWDFDRKSGSDIAVTPVELPKSLEKVVSPIGVGAFALETNDDLDIGTGDDVFMVGRFVDYDGGQTNTPSVRFGCISIMPVPIEQETGKVVDCYCLDMHSRTGYSGSPVFAYRTPGTDLHLLEENHLFDMAGGFLWFLGIHVGQFPEALEILSTAKKKQLKPVEKKYIKGLSGMTYALPASRIKEVLMMKKFRDQRAAIDAELLKDSIENGFAPEAESAIDEANSSDAKRDNVLKTKLDTPPNPSQIDPD